MFKPRLLTLFLLSLFIFTSCSQSPGICPTVPRGDISEAELFAENEQLPFRYPLEALSKSEEHFSGNFCVASGSGFGPDGEYHAAEDTFKAAGTPVYAFSDGKVSFSGPMGGYGWLVIIDHPQANLYSLYGHISPSRWRTNTGKVEKGDLIGYLGDDDENGGSAEYPLRPHLHFGVRAGQRGDYPGMGEWRWQAGWIKPCPRDIGWLQPSIIITNQEIPAGGFSMPKGNFLAKWGIEIFMSGMYLIGGLGMSIYSIRKNKPLLLIAYSVVCVLAGWQFYNKGVKSAILLFVFAFLATGFFLFRAIRRIRQRKTAST